MADETLNDGLRLITTNLGLFFSHRLKHEVIPVRIFQNRG